MRPRRALAVLLVAATATACGGDDESSDASVNITSPTAPPPTASVDVGVVGTTWRLEQIVTGAGAEPVPDGVVATLAFAEDGTVAVDTGCNTGSATVAIDATQMQFGPLALTKKACEEGPTRVETALVALTLAPLDYRVAGDQLVLISGANQLLLTAD